MRQIGFVTDVWENFSKNFRHTDARTWRFVPMAHYCQQMDVELLIYSRYHINTQSKLAFGYAIENKNFCPVIREIPRVNGYWFYNSAHTKNKNHLTKKKFIQFFKDENIELYPGHHFSKVLTDKYQTFKIVSQLKDVIQLYTEIYLYEKNQIIDFFKRNKKIFFKPRLGSQGNNIFVAALTHEKYYFVYFYSNKIKHTYKVNSIEEMMTIILKNKIDGDYIIQEACNIAQLLGRPFIIRSILLDDGKNWHTIHKIVSANKESDIANTTQGSNNYTLEETFEKLFGQNKTLYMEKLNKLCLTLISHFSCHYQGEMMEVAFDFLIDKNKNFILLEADIHPGLKKPGMTKKTFSNIFDLSKDEQLIYNKYIKPHGEYLAKFLISKLDKEEQNELS